MSSSGLLTAASPSLGLPAVRRTTPGRARSVLLCFLASRAAVLAGVLRTELRWHENVVALAQSWDSRWYIGISDSGYPRGLAEHAGTVTQSSWAFLPGFPLLLRTVRDTLGVQPVTAAGLVNLVLTLTLLMVVWSYATALLAGTTAPAHLRTSALVAVSLVAFWPVSVVLSLPYAEPLFLAAAAGGLLALRRRRWELAGACTAVAVVTHPTGLALLAALVVAVVRVPDLPWWRRLACLLAPLSTLGGYLAYCQLRGGSLLIWWRAESAWTLPDMRYPWGFLLIHHNPALRHSSEMLALSYVVLAALLWLGWRHREELSAPERVYCALLVVFFLASAAGPCFRFELELIPLLVLAGRALRRVRVPLWVCGGAALAVTTALYLQPGYLIP